MKKTFGISQVKTIAIDLLLLVAGLILKPATAFVLNKMPSCIFVQYGFVCPSCGGTRFAFSLVRGNLADAWHYHQYFFLICIYLVMTVLLMNLGYLFHIKFCKEFFWKMLKPSTIIVLVFGFVIFGLTRSFLI